MSTNDKITVKWKLITLTLLCAGTMFLTSCGEADNDEYSGDLIIKDSMYKSTESDKDITNKNFNDSLAKMRSEKALGIFDGKGNPNKDAEEPNSNTSKGISHLKIDDQVMKEVIPELEAKYGPIQNERDFIAKFAESSVGKISYYWGGRAKNWGWKGNNFGSKVKADYKGRTKKGLDCSGFVMWAYGTCGVPQGKWYSTHTMNLGSRQIKKEELQPGDIALTKAPGAGSNHVGIYIGDGKFVHSSGSKGTTTANHKWGHYRRALVLENVNYTEQEYKKNKKGE